MTLGEKIRSAREAQNLSQEQLAEKIDFPVRCIIAWEEDRITPYSSTLEMLCQILHIPNEEEIVHDTAEYLLESPSIPMVSDNPPDYQADTSHVPTETASIDYQDLPEGKHAELIDGKLYFKNTPEMIHQILVGELYFTLRSYVKSKNSSCIVLPAPFSVNLTADGKTIVQPDVVVVCDRNKITRYDCEGAPDFLIEVVSESNRRMDYSIKQSKYADAGVREYWIVDPQKKCTTVYLFEEDYAPAIVPFDQMITVGIFEGLSFCIGNMVQEFL